MDPDTHPALKRAPSHDSQASQSSKTSSRLLFGEIPSPLSPTGNCSRSYFPNSSICNLVLSTSSSFLRFWLNESCRENVLRQIGKEDLPNFRLVCHDFANRAAPALFEDITVSFKASTFSKPARVFALDRIGRHVKRLTFNMPHAPQTFLPPLIDPLTGAEVPFRYEPQVQKPRSAGAGAEREGRYGPRELTDLLIQQYPPLFHAATNVPAFIRAFSALPSLAHLRVSCPGQEPAQRYRRDAVDYALISLRIAVERAPLDGLAELSLLAVHPAAAFYLQPLHGFGASPVSTRRWAQIKRLDVAMDGAGTSDAAQRTCHLRMLHAYLRTFSASLERFSFRWAGERGPNPLTLHLEPRLQGPDSQPPSPADAEPPSPSSTTTTASSSGGLRPLAFPRLRVLALDHVHTDASALASHLLAHRGHLSDLAFDDVTLRSGTWDDALEPLTALARARRTTTTTSRKNPRRPRRDSHQQSAECTADAADAADDAEEMDVPLILAPSAANTPRPPPLRRIGGTPLITNSPPLPAAAAAPLAPHAPPSRRHPRRQKGAGGGGAGLHLGRWFSSVGRERNVLTKKAAGDGAGVQVLPLATIQAEHMRRGPGCGGADGVRRFLGARVFPWR